MLGVANHVYLCNIFRDKRPCQRGFGFADEAHCREGLPGGSEEARQEGHVRWEVYGAYMAATGFLLTTIILTSLILMQVGTQSVQCPHNSSQDVPLGNTLCINKLCFPGRVVKFYVAISAMQWSPLLCQVVVFVNLVMQVVFLKFLCSPYVVKSLCGIECELLAERCMGDP